MADQGGDVSVAAPLTKGGDGLPQPLVEIVASSQGRIRCRQRTPRNRQLLYEQLQLLYYGGQFGPRRAGSDGCGRSGSTGS